MLSVERASHDPLSPRGDHTESGCGPRFSPICLGGPEPPRCTHVAQEHAGASSYTGSGKRSCVAHPRAWYVLMVSWLVDLTLEWISTVKLQKKSYAADNPTLYVGRELRRQKRSPQGSRFDNHIIHQSSRDACLRRSHRDRRATAHRTHTPSSLLRASTGDRTDGDGTARRGRDDGRAALSTLSLTLRPRCPLSALVSLSDV